LQELLTALDWGTVAPKVATMLEAAARNLKAEFVEALKFRLDPGSLQQMAVELKRKVRSQPQHCGRQ
jgi:hypothetical protein